MGYQRFGNALGLVVKASKGRPCLIAVIITLLESAPLVPESSSQFDFVPRCLRTPSQCPRRSAHLSRQPLSGTGQARQSHSGLPSHPDWAGLGVNFPLSFLQSSVIPASTWMFTSLVSCTVCVYMLQLTSIQCCFFVMALQLRIHNFVTFFN